MLRPELGGLLSRLVAHGEPTRSTRAEGGMRPLWENERKKGGAVVKPRIFEAEDCGQGHKSGHGEQIWDVIRGRFRMRK